MLLVTGSVNSLRTWRRTIRIQRPVQLIRDRGKGFGALGLLHFKKRH
jgi:hypothetical protein